mmetsp:Transcript_38131/g.82922  ORF Transcript_38131/g.82922 Transcript_38131/m.82922 type:complete len:229 (-) Transcript_38131:1015-1701(-)
MWPASRFLSSTLRMRSRDMTMLGLPASRKHSIAVSSSMWKSELSRSRVHSSGILICSAISHASLKCRRFRCWKNRFFATSRVMLRSTPGWMAEWEVRTVDSRLPLFSWQVSRPLYSCTGVNPGYCVVVPTMFTMAPLMATGTYTYTWKRRPSDSTNTFGSTVSHRHDVTWPEKSGTASTWSFTGLNRSTWSWESTKTQRVPSWLGKSFLISPSSWRYSLTRARSSSPR